MGIIDIVIIIIAFVFGISGLKKGFLRQLGGVISIVGAIIITSLLYKKVTEIACGMNFYNTIYDKMVSLATNRTGEAASYTLATLGKEGFDTALNNVKLPAFITKLFSEPFEQALLNTPDMTFAEFIGSVLSKVIITLIVCVALYLIVMIIFKLIFRGLTKLSENSAIGVVNRILGLTWGLVKTFIVVCIAMVILSSLTSISGLGDSIYSFISSDMKLEVEGFGIAKFFYQQNPLITILSKFGLEKILSFNFSKSEIIIIGGIL